MLHYETSVTNLKKLNFKKLTLQEKISLKARERPTPNWAISQQSTNRRKSYTGQFTKNIYVDHLEANKLLCLSYASILNVDFPEDSLEKCTVAYPMLDGDIHRGSGLVQLLALLNSGGLCSTFSKVMKLIKSL